MKARRNKRGIAMGFFPSHIASIGGSAVVATTIASSRSLACEFENEFGMPIPFTDPGPRSLREADA
jgi:hypothetical protein